MEYLYEIENPNLKQKFSDLSRIFDYIFYGEFEINDDYYHMLENKFKVAKQSGQLEVS